ncbi:cytochrome P450 [Mycena pura]|uniref:Cytochrome P450 n=1 Tax=Mycena pura TaxID=153505 RepID=A0AAD6V6B0_9AGAR|nr:cytochrome P450 [Mycena pura]
MDDLDTRTLALYGLALALSVYYWQNGHKRGESTIPAVIGGNGPISRCLACLRFLRNSRQVLAEGYRQHPTGVFRVPILFRDWFYVACGRKRVQEIASAPSDILSLNEAATEISMEYTLGTQLVHNTYQVLSIRGGLTRSLDLCFPEVRDEIEHAFDDVLALKGNEWKLVQVYAAMVHIGARTSNRLFVGLPLCRDQEYLELNIDFAVSVIVRGQLISSFPDFLKPIFGPILSKRNSSLRHALKFLQAIIDERLEKENQYGQDWPERPNDLISWLLDHAKGEERTTSALAMRVLLVNVGAIHSSGMAFTNALYDLAKYPEYIGPMREEAEQVIAQKGWSKAALADLHKMDSFIRESQRFAAASGVFGMVRKVVAKDGFAFSDGTVIPHGAILSVPIIEVHRDPALYPDADTFDGFRFSRMREEAVDSTEKPAPKMVREQMVSTTPDHIIFGHGRHACPGRFFVAMEIKTMLAHILLNYDIKAVESVRPPDQGSAFFGSLGTDREIWMKNREGF